MIKWFSGSRKDYLATAPANQSSFPVNDSSNIYTITRVNPIYHEEEPSAKSKKDADQNVQELQRKSISSGYASVTTSASSCGSSSGTEGDSTAFAELTKRDKKAVKRQERRKRCGANGLIENVLAANYSSIKRRPKRELNGCLTSHLSPIPEGVVDHVIPHPIWPTLSEMHDICCRIGAHGRKTHNGCTDPVNFMYKYNESFPSAHGSLKHFYEGSIQNKYLHRWRECICLDENRNQTTDIVDFDEIDRLISGSKEVFHDLANLIAHLMQKRSNLAVHDLLVALHDSLRKRAENSEQLQNHTVNGEFILFNNPLISNRDDKISKNTYVSSSSSGADKEYSSSSGDSPPMRFKRSSYKTTSGTNYWKKIDRNAFFHQRDSSSSSVESLPPSTASFGNMEHQDQVYSTPSCTTESDEVVSRGFYSEDCGSRAFDKLINAKRKISDAGVDASPQKRLLDPMNSISKNKRTDIVLMKKVEHPYYVSMGRPDFTLDLPQAERMMKKIANAKRYRCWCRLTTSTLGLIFFILSVVVVSLVITKGQKVFGAI